MAGNVRIFLSYRADDHNVQAPVSTTFGHLKVSGMPGPDRTCRCCRRES